MPPTPVPALNGRSAAAEFLEEHDQLARDLMLVTDENKTLRDQLQEQAMRVDFVTRERDYWRNRANMFFSYAVELAASLTATIENVTAGIARAKQIAAEITREKLAKAVDTVEDDGAARVVHGMSARIADPLPNSFDAAGQATPTPSR